MATGGNGKQKSFDEIRVELSGYVVTVIVPDDERQVDRHYSSRYKVVGAASEDFRCIRSKADALRWIDLHQRSA